MKIETKCARRVARGLLSFTLASIMVVPSIAHSASSSDAYQLLDWVKLPGQARDISVGANGAVWIIGNTKEGGGYGIYRWDSKSKKWIKVKGGGVRISVDPKGNPWIVNSKAEIYHYERGGFVKKPGRGRDVGVGPKGHVWLVGNTKEGGGYGIYRLVKGKWQKVKGGAVRIDVNWRGRPWIVNSSGKIFHFKNGKAFSQLPGSASDIAVGPKGVQRIVSAQGVYKWTGNRWLRSNGSGVNIDVGPKGGIWLTNKRAEIYWSDGKPRKAMTKGVFAQKYYLRQPGAKLPTCDNWTDSVARHATRAANYIGSQAVKTGNAIDGAIRKGDFDGLKKHLNQQWNDIEKAAATSASLAVYTPVNPFYAANIVGELLPSGKIKQFVQKGTRLQKQFAKSVAGAGLDFIEGDIKEISDDSWSLLKNYKDPEAFATKFAELNQKWNPVVIWTYVLTEDDPLEGMKKAAGAYLRVKGMVSLYANKKGFSKTFIKKSVKLMALRHAEEVPSLMAKIGVKLTPAEKSAFMAAVVGTLTEYTTTPDVAPKSIMPNAKLTSVAAEFVYNDKGSGGNNDWALWRPKLPTNKDCVSLGDQAKRGYGKVSNLHALCGVGSRPGGAWTFPTGCKLIWSDRCSGANRDGSVWKPVCPDSYISPGFVAHGNAAASAPALARIACLKKDKSLLRIISGRGAEMKFVADDRGSGAKMNLKLYTRRYGDMSLMVALPSYGKAALQQIELPVPNQ